MLTRGLLTLGDLLSFYGALALLRSSGNLALAALPQIIEGRAAAERVDAALAESRAPEYTGTRQVVVRGDVRLDGVVFGYDARRILRGLTLHVAPGERLGVSGDSGAGKTTISMLLAGLYRPEAGTIAFDGTSIAEIDLGHLRRQIGMMPQDPLILGETVLANITFGLDDPAAAERDGRLAEAVAIADVDEFVRALPDGYQTVLGSRGVNLSGGQRQRLALARALVKRPRLLIMDEPTNHLGTATVRRVLDALRVWPAPPTVIAISHDPDLLSMLPRVVHLSDGVLRQRTPVMEGAVLTGAVESGVR